MCCCRCTDIKLTSLCHSLMRALSRFTCSGLPQTNIPLSYGYYYIPLKVRSKNEPDGCQMYKFVWNIGTMTCKTLRKCWKILRNDLTDFYETSYFSLFIVSTNFCFSSRLYFFDRLRSLDNATFDWYHSWLIIWNPFLAKAWAMWSWKISILFWKFVYFMRKFM